jgi:glutaminase
MRYESIFSKIYSDLQSSPDLGEIADYIPELKSAQPDAFAVHLSSVQKESFAFGTSSQTFTIQSIAKVLSLVLAYSWEDSSLWQRVGVEPSGTSFNSLLLLEHDQGIPRNPFINAGALVICDILVSHLTNPKQDFLNFVRSLSGNEHISYNTRVAASEKATGFRNYALINLMKSFGNIENDINKVMDFYFDLCSIEMDCKALSETFLFLANNGISPWSNEQILTASKTKRINAIMLLCGFYDEAGEFAFKVGLPGKSGVSGGIVAVHPNHFAIAVFSPKLNKKGNSNRGMQFLEAFTTETSQSIF